MSLKNGFIGSPRTFVRTSDIVTESARGMSAVDGEADSKTQCPEKSGVSWATNGTTTDTATTIKHGTVWMNRPLFMFVVCLIFPLVQRSNVPNEPRALA